MNFKSITLFIGLALCSSLANSQNFETGQNEVSAKDVTKLKTSTLYVIVENPESSFGKALESAFDKYWKFSKYEFIKPSDLEDKLKEKDAYFFAFSCMLSGGVNVSESGGHGGGLFYNLFIDSNSVAAERKNDNKVHGGVVDDRTHTYVFNYGVFMSNHRTKYTDDDWMTPYNVVQTVQMLDYVNLDGAQGMTMNVNTNMYKPNPQMKLSVKEPLSVAECKTIGEIPFYILRLNKHLKYVAEHSGEPEAKTSKNEVSYSANGKTDVEKAKITSYDGGLEKLKGRTLLVDSNLCDKIGIQILAKGLGIKESNIQLVSWNDILAAVENQTPKTAVVYLHDMGRAGKEWNMIWSTDGTFLASFEFSVSHDIMSSKRWGFQFPKATTYGIDRSEIQIQN
jgi:hypothetical protein